MVINRRIKMDEKCSNCANSETQVSGDSSRSLKKTSFLISRKQHSTMIFMCFLERRLQCNSFSFTLNTFTNLLTSTEWIENGTGSCCL